MATLFISLFTLILLLTSAFVVMIVLMQRSSNSGGMGSALGGGATEQVLGAETNTVLTRGTIYGTILFFMIALGLHLGYLGAAHERPTGRDATGLVGEDEVEVSSEGVTIEAEELIEAVNEAAEGTISE